MFNVSVTAIVKRFDGRMLITKRTANKSKWPNKWTVPGGKLEEKDFLGKPTTTNSQWYHVLENAVAREVKEETGLHIFNIRYLCNLIFPAYDPCSGTLVISFVADLDGSGADPDHIVLHLEECDEFEWVTAKEAEEYDLIEGILDELKEAECLT